MTAIVWRALELVSFGRIWVEDGIRRTGGTVAKKSVMSFGIHASEDLLACG